MFLLCRVDRMLTSPPRLPPLPIELLLLPSATVPLDLKQVALKWPTLTQFGRATCAGLQPEPRQFSIPPEHFFFLSLSSTVSLESSSLFSSLAAPRAFSASRQRKTSFFTSFQAFFTHSLVTKTSWVIYARIT